MSGQREGSGDDLLSQLYNTIRGKFEADGLLDELRCVLQARMVAMMEGKEGPSLRGSNTRFAELAKSNQAIQLVNKVIMEFLGWHGYYYTAEMFSTEADIEDNPPMREYLEAALGNFQCKEIPVLLELVSIMMKSKHLEKINEQK